MNGKRSIGVITARECPLCGHHEIGYRTNDGVFHPLRPGNRIQVFESKIIPGGTDVQNASIKDIPKPTQNEQPAREVWVPDPIRMDKNSIMKYGVFIPSDTVNEEMSGTAYESAYLQKLRELVEKERFTPLPIILDRFFSAPNLATGSAKKIAEALYQELDEIRAPVAQIREWLTKKDPENLKKMIYPQPPEALTGITMSNNQVKKVLEDLTLEEFFELL